MRVLAAHGNRVEAWPAADHKPPGRGIGWVYGPLDALETRKRAIVTGIIVLSVLILPIVGLRSWLRDAADLSDRSPPTNGRSNATRRTPTRLAKATGGAGNRADLAVRYLGEEMERRYVESSPDMANLRVTLTPQRWHTTDYAKLPAF